jgi:DNA-directed RNA polymerase subunit RPC12/RpoP
MMKNTVSFGLDLKGGPTYTCLRCNHTWQGRVSRKPIRCPRCSSVAWDKKKERTDIVKGEVTISAMRELYIW